MWKAQIFSHRKPQMLAGNIRKLQQPAENNMVAFVPLGLFPCIGAALVMRAHGNISFRACLSDVCTALPSMSLMEVPLPSPAPRTQTPDPPQDILLCKNGSTILRHYWLGLDTFTGRAKVFSVPAFEDRKPLVARMVSTLLCCPRIAWNVQERHSNTGAAARELRWRQPCVKSDTRLSKRSFSKL